MNTHRIAWKSLRTGVEGHGQPFGDRAEIDRICAEMNVRHRCDVHHWPEAVEPAERSK